MQLQNGITKPCMSCQGLTQLPALQVVAVQHPGPCFCGGYRYHQLSSLKEAVSLLTATASAHQCTLVSGPFDSVRDFSMLTTPCLSYSIVCRGCNQGHNPLPGEATPLI